MMICLKNMAYISNLRLICGNKISSVIDYYFLYKVLSEKLTFYYYYLITKHISSLKCIYNIMEDFCTRY